MLERRYLSGKHLPKEFKFHTRIPVSNEYISIIFSPKKMIGVNFLEIIFHPSWSIRKYSTLFISLKVPIFAFSANHYSEYRITKT